MGANNATGLALEHNYNKQLDQDSIIPQTKRFTIYGEGGYDVTDNVSLYFEGLYNRRKTKTVAHRQLFFNQFTSSTILPAFFCSPVRDNNPNCRSSTGDPINTGFTGDVLLEPIVIAPANSSTDVKYLRGVAGVHADLSNVLHNGFFDFYFQHSKSDGDYSRDIIFRDAVEFGVAAWRTQSCAGTVTAIRGVPCIDINYTDPRVLAGNFTPEERAFLFGVDKATRSTSRILLKLSFGGDIVQVARRRVEVRARCSVAA